MCNWIDSFSEVNKMSHLFKETMDYTMLVVKSDFHTQIEFLKLVSAIMKFLMSLVAVLLNVLLKIVLYNKIC